MPFLDELEERVRGKYPTTRMPRPVLLGVICCALAVVVIAALGVASTARGDFIVDYSASSPSAANEDEIDNVEASESSAASSCFVYVAGAVKNPGVYKLQAGSRVDDAVKAAGGMSRKADSSAVNLARVIVDGEQITIPEKGSTSNVGMTLSSAANTASESSGKVNINTATSEELESLPGIGEVTAQKIISNRESEGAFASTEDLKRVSGIGDKKYEALADLITV